MLRQTCHAYVTILQHIRRFSALPQLIDCVERSVSEAKALAVETELTQDGRDVTPREINGSSPVWLRFTTSDMRGTSEMHPEVMKMRNQLQRAQSKADANIAALQAALTSTEERRVADLTSSGERRVADLRSGEERRVADVAALRFDLTSGEENIRKLQSRTDRLELITRYTHEFMVGTSPTSSW